MTYLPTSADYLDQIIGIWAVAIIISSVVAIIRYRKSRIRKTSVDNTIPEDTGNPSLKQTRVVLISSAVVVVALLVSVLYGNVGESKIKDNFLSNLKSKYAIDSVKTPLGGYPKKGQVGKPGVVYVGDARTQIIEITAGGTPYTFVVRQDALTFEPTLYDVPENLKEFRSPKSDLPASKDAESLLRSGTE